jgi:prepilin-type N-terminal cleavage/methylation domain-containing protein
MRIQSQRRGHHRQQAGFSLIEVMIAVIVLATGLLALAALQINLTQSSADAKARSRIAALMSSVVDYERSVGFSSLAQFTGTTASSSACDTTSSIAMFIKCTETDAGVSGISLTQKVTEYYAVPSATSFTTGTAPTVNIYGDYKRVDLTANWNDAAGNARTMGATTLVSSLGLNSGATTLLSLNLLTSANLNPVVHETNPSSTAGVIPIAIGSNTNTAATNPKPTVQTSGASSTTFNTLTYSQGINDSNSTSTIQKRVETEVAECVCQGSSTNPFASSTLYGQSAFRPTYWNGTQYTSPIAVPSLTPFATSASSVTQSAECTVCCRDHHDLQNPSTPTTTSPYTTYTAPLYDAVTGDPNRYKVTTTTVRGNTTITSPISLAGAAGSRQKVTNFTDSTQPWLDSCRMIRVDGLWRVAADLQSLQMGFLATTLEGFATSATPDPTAEVNYQNFVIDYLGQYVTYIITGGTVPVANTIFASHNLDVPPIIDALTTPGNYRYLHFRGLYVDSLETAAITKLTNVKSSCSSANYPTCVLPFLPFATINLTGVGYGVPPLGPTAGGSGAWSTTAILSATVGSGTDTVGTGLCTSINFFGGCVSGKGLTNSVTIAANMAASNSAVASSLYKSPYEELSSNRLSDSQNFTVTGTNTSDQYFVQVSGPVVTLTDPNLFTTSSTVTWLTDDASTTNEPTVQWGFGANNATAGPDGCFTSLGSSADTNPNPYNCVTTVLTSSLPINSIVGNYNQIINNPIANNCNGGSGTVNQPTLVCYTVSAVTLTTDTAATNRIDCHGPPSPLNSNCYNITTPYTVSNTKTTGETTTITIASKNLVPAALAKPYLNVTFTATTISRGLQHCDIAGVATFDPPASCP